jgi:hypothetical protein
MISDGWAHDLPAGLSPANNVHVIRWSMKLR